MEIKDIIIIIGMLFNLIGVIVIFFKGTIKVGGILEKINKIDESYKSTAKSVNILNHELGDVRTKLSSIETNIEWLKKNGKNQREKT